MKIAFFDAKDYDKQYFDANNKDKKHEIVYFKENLTINNVSKVEGFDAVCGFVNTYGDKYVLELLARQGVKVWLQRSMGYNKIDLTKAEELGIKVFRVPNYSAESVAEFAATLLLALNRNLITATKRVCNYNFSVNGLQGKVIHGSTVGVVGSGKIGRCFINIMKGMGANVIVFDSWCEKNQPELADELGFKYVSFTKLLKQSDFISLHAPLLPSTRYLIDKVAVNKMKKGVIIINTARGELIDIKAVLFGLKEGIINGLGLDVLEREEGRFYEDVSEYTNEYKKMDPEWKELLEHERVLIASHQAFLTDVALNQIARITLDNATCAEKGDFSKALKQLDNGKVLNG